jgi:hypothetical protein
MSGSRSEAEVATGGLRMYSHVQTAWKAAGSMDGRVMVGVGFECGISLAMAKRGDTVRSLRWMMKKRASGPAWNAMFLPGRGLWVAIFVCREKNGESPFVDC